jgi:hypothetical protein
MLERIAKVNRWWSTSNELATSDQGLSVRQISKKSIDLRA